MSIFVNKEMRALIPPLSEEELDQLEANVVAEGIRDPLVTWPQPDGREMLIDGHNRFDISCRYNGIPFKVVRKEFADMDEAKAWVIRNQFGRRNLSAYDRSVLALKLKPLIAERAKQNQVASGGAVPQKSAKPINTRNELAKIAGVSHDTIHKVDVIEQKATERTKELVREGKLSINQAYNSVHPKQPDPVKTAKAEHEEYEQKKAERVVDFRTAQNDKVNTDIIETALFQEVLKLLNAIDKFGMTHKTADLDCLSKMVKDDERGIYLDRIESCQMILEKIKFAMNRRG